MHVYQKSSVTEAVEMATQFRKEGRYTWFRGQTHVLPPTPTFLRLNADDQRKAEERLKRYCHWLLNTPGLGAFRKDIDGAIAVAQHYGLPTSFLDFTRTPAVAGFFASTDAKKYKVGTACIYCLNTDDLAEVWGFIRKALPHYPDIEPVEVEVPNLWRLEAQDGTFLRCPLNWDRYYPMDRIEFPLGNRPSYPTSDQIYPGRKSPLEELLDHYFSAEQSREFNGKIREYFPEAKVLEIQSPTCGYHAEYFVQGGLSKRLDWAKCRLQPWLTVSREKFRATATGEITLKLKHHLNPKQIRCEVAFAVRHSLQSQPSLRNQAVRWRIEPRGQPPKALNSALDRLWNGLRRLPFSDDDIAEGIGLCIALYSLKFHKGERSYNEQTAIAERCLGPCLVIEISSWSGSHARAIVGQNELSMALRPDARKKLKFEYRKYGEHVGALLQLCWEPRRLFVFEPFSRLFATQLAPTQVLMSETVPDHFSPARIAGFGLP